MEWLWESAWKWVAATGMAVIVVLIGRVGTNDPDVMAAVYALGAGTMFSLRLIPSGIPKGSVRYKWSTWLDFILLAAIVGYTWLSATHWLLGALVSAKVGAFTEQLCLIMVGSSMVASSGALLFAARRR